jgi:hypothetical protein
LNAAKPTLTDVNGYLIETFMFHVTRFEFFKRQINNQAHQLHDDETLRKRLL